MLLVQSCTNQDLGSADSATKLEVSNSMHTLKEIHPQLLLAMQIKLQHGGSPTSTRSSVNNEVTEIKDSITASLCCILWTMVEIKVLFWLVLARTPLLFLPTLGHWTFLLIGRHSYRHLRWELQEEHQKGTTMHIWFSQIKVCFFKMGFFWKNRKANC